MLASFFNNVRVSETISASRTIFTVYIRKKEKPSQSSQSIQGNQQERDSLGGGFSDNLGVRPVLYSNRVRWFSHPRYSLVRGASFFPACQLFHSLLTRMIQARFEAIDFANKLDAGLQVTGTAVSPLDRLILLAGTDH